MEGGSSVQVKLACSNAGCWEGNE